MRCCDSPTRASASSSPRSGARWHPERMQLVLASNNARKLKELRALFGSLPIQLATQGSLGIGEADEPHVTFVENALAKARHAALQAGGPPTAGAPGLWAAAPRR